MCGRYDLNAIAQELVARFGARLFDVSDTGSSSDASTAVLSDLRAGWQPRYNIAPGQYNPVVTRDSSGHKQLELMRWGLVPAWSREARVPYSTINARAETVASKPAFRKPLATRRCLVPATGYYEWMERARGAVGAHVSEESPGNRGKQPYRISLRGEGKGVDEIFAFAGLYDVWHGPGGEELRTYSIVTTTANDTLSVIHSRMPVILPADVEESWLEANNTDTEKLISLLKPFSEEALAAYPVSTLVNSTINERRELIERVAA